MINRTFFSRRIIVLTLLVITFLDVNGWAKKSKVFRFPVDLEGSPATGNPKAPITIVEASDFECPFCSMAQSTLREVQERYPNQIKLVFKHFPLAFHEHALQAHLAATCAEEQGKFWEYRKILFENQRALHKENLIRYAQELGLNVESFVGCLEQEKYRSKIEEDREEVLGYGVQGTPSFFVNGRLLPGAQPFGSFQQVIDEELQLKD